MLDPRPCCYKTISSAIIEGQELKAVCLLRLGHEGYCCPVHESLTKEEEVMLNIAKDPSLALAFRLGQRDGRMQSDRVTPRWWARQGPRDSQDFSIGALACRDCGKEPRDPIPDHQRDACPFCGYTGFGPRPSAVKQPAS